MKKIKNKKLNINTFKNIWRQLKVNLAAETNIYSVLKLAWVNEEKGKSIIKDITLKRHDFSGKCVKYVNRIIKLYATA